MMKVLTISVLAVLGGIMTAGRTEARPVEKALINVPFAFEAGGQMLPAGNYQIELTMQAKAGVDGVEVVVLRGKDQFAYAAFAASVDKGNATFPRLQFRMDGQNPVLAGLAVSGKQFHVGTKTIEWQTAETTTRYVTVEDSAAGH